MVKESSPLELTHPQEVSTLVAVTPGVVLAPSTVARAAVDTARLLGHLLLGRRWPSTGLNVVGGASGRTPLVR